MAVVARNKRSQEEIYKSLGLNYPGGSGSSGSSGNKMVDDTPGYVTMSNPTPSASQQKGIPGNPISFSGPSAAVTSGIVGVSPNADSSQDKSQNGSQITTSRYTTKSGISQPQRAGYVRQSFSPSDVTQDYFDAMQDIEGERPDPFQSQYEGTIQSILDGILNRKSFDLSTDKNYGNLYNLYAQQYRAEADRGMRDTMGAMQAATGGYGSTAATAAAGQAYDRAMEGLNGQNMALMQLAYQMYGDETADRYNQLGAVQGLDNTDYSRYRDTVGDWQTDRAYYANQYQNMLGNDMSQYQYDTNMDWAAYQDAANRDWQEYADAADRSYQAERDELDDYDSAFNKAYQLASAGQNIPAHYAGYLEDDTIASLQALAAEVKAKKAAGGSGGGGGGRGSGKGSDKLPTTMTQDEFNANYARILSETGKKSEADNFADYVRAKGIEIQPSTYSNFSDIKRAEVTADPYMDSGTFKAPKTVKHTSGEGVKTGLNARIEEIQRKAGLRR